MEPAPFGQESIIGSICEETRRELSQKLNKTVGASVSVRQQARSTANTFSLSMVGGAHVVHPPYLNYWCY
jgi:hypothetical protein